LSVWVLSQAATSASTACPNSVLAPLRKTSVSGGVEHPHDTPPYPFMPSPTFGLSSHLGIHKEF
jgi:hypothetical protein